MIWVLSIKVTFFHYKFNFLVSKAELEALMIADIKREMRAKQAHHPTIYDKVVSKEIQVRNMYEDWKCMAFEDINPQAPFHCVVIPKDKDGLSRLMKAEEKHKEILGHMMVAVAKIAQDHRLNGYRVVINDGPAGCQDVYHLSIHILGGSQCSWPPGTYMPPKKTTNQNIN